jgi:mRNA-degrading endonuclease RelE of RelBE toxin-antitoxin system
MEIVFSDRAIEALEDAPPNIRRAFEKQLRFLAGNIQHPSLHAKKYDEGQDLWQARVGKSWLTQEPPIGCCSGLGLLVENV